MGVFNRFRKKKIETPRQDILEIPKAIDANALQARVAMALHALILLDDSATPIDYQDYTKVDRALNRLSDEAKELGGEVIRLMGNRELAILSEGKASFSGTITPKAPYPLMGILPDAMRDECSGCMLWGPGHKSFFRVVAYRRQEMRNDPAFGGNVFLFNETLFCGTDLRCCLVNTSGTAALLPDDWLRHFISHLEVNVVPEYKVPLVIGDPSDADSWRWAGQAQGQKLIILGNII